MLLQNHIKSVSTVPLTTNGILRKENIPSERELIIYPSFHIHALFFFDKYISKVVMSQCQTIFFD